MKFVLAALVVAVTIATATADAGGDRPVQRIEIVENYSAAIANELLEAYKTRKEFAYCLFGEEEWRDSPLGGRDRVLFITGALRPRQAPYSFARDGRIWHLVSLDDCPPGTAMFLHAHPLIDDFMMSELDYAVFSSTPFKYHAITFPSRIEPECDPKADGCLIAKVIVYWFNDEGREIRVLKDWRVVPWAGPPTAR